MPILRHVKAKNRKKYFAEQYEATRNYPKRMLDINIASDHTKVRKVFVVNSDEATYINSSLKIFAQC
jgi:hypothetical protein